VRRAPTRQCRGKNRRFLLDVYGHFLPSEYTGYADALSQPPNAPYAHPEAFVPADALDESLASPTRDTDEHDCYVLPPRTLARGRRSTHSLIRPKVAASPYVPLVWPCPACPSRSDTSESGAPAS